MKFIFTLTAGRTGTAYLTELLRRSVPKAEVWHEILNFGSFGQDTPDISHLQAFNCFGNTPEVQAFWKRKLDNILSRNIPCYVETSHVLMKAGLVENMALLAQEHEVHFVRLTRDTFKTINSYHMLGDMANKGNQWIWYLDPDYSRNFVKFAPFAPYGIHGTRLWYVCEIALRAAYYKKHYSMIPNLYFHTADIDDLNTKNNVAELLGSLGLAVNSFALPPKQNVTFNGVIMRNKDKTMLQALIKKLAFNLDAAVENVLSKEAF